MDACLGKGCHLHFFPRDGWYSWVKGNTHVLLHSCEHWLPGGALTVQGFIKTYTASNFISKIGDCILYQFGQLYGLSTQGGSHDLHTAWYTKMWVMGFAHTHSLLQVGF